LRAACTARLCDGFVSDFVVSPVVSSVQMFLAGMHSVSNNELELSDGDAVLLGALCLQATRGDFDSSVHTSALIIKNDWLSFPKANLAHAPQSCDQKFVSMLDSSVTCAKDDNRILSEHSHISLNSVFPVFGRLDYIGHRKC
jgi:hypothetical protein